MPSGIANLIESAVSGALSLARTASGVDHVEGLSDFRPVDDVRSFLSCSSPAKRRVFFVRFAEMIFGSLNPSVYLNKGIHVVLVFHGVLPLTRDCTHTEG